MSTWIFQLLRKVFVCAAAVGVVAVLISSSAQAAPGRCDAGLLDLACEAGKTAAGKAGQVITAPVRVAAGGAVDMLTAWVADSAQWLLGRVIRFIDDSTSPDLGAGWFAERYRFMVGLGSLVLLPMLLLASIRAVMNQDVSQLLRSFLVYLPMAVLATFLAVFLAQALLSVTDAMSAAVAKGIVGDASEVLDGASEGLRVTTGQVGAPSFAVFFGALLLIIGSFFVWLELLVRSAAVTVTVFLLPLMLAGLVWPATAHWTRRMIETLVALILSKFVIVAVISLATSAMADPGGGGFGAVMGGAALMLMAAFSPLALLKLMPAVEAGATAQLDGLSRKPVQSIRPGGSVNQAVSIMRSKVGRSSTAYPAMASAGGLTAAGAASVAAAAGAVKSPKTSSPIRKPEANPGDQRQPGDARSDVGVGGEAKQSSSVKAATRRGRNDNTDG